MQNYDIKYIQKENKQKFTWIKVAKIVRNLIVVIFVVDIGRHIVFSRAF